MEQKYVVFKVEDWKEWQEWVSRNTMSPGVLPAPVKDLFVIRYQDVLAGPGLHAYASAAENMLEGLDLAFGGEPRPREDDPFSYKLERVRDAAFEAAQAADEYPNKKVPD